MSRALVKASIPDCTSLAGELARQPEFFERHREELPDLASQRPDLGAARYSGERSDDEQINLRVGAMRMLGMSDRAIERECGVDRRTIPHRLAWLESSGRIPALKERLTQKTGSLAESSALVLSVLMDRAGVECSVELAAMIKAVATSFGITSEKLLLLTGAATEIVEHRVGDGRAEMEEFKRTVIISAEVVRAPVDLESSLVAEDLQQIEAGVLAGHQSDTTAPAAQVAGDERTEAGASERAGGGGGRGEAGGPRAMTG